MRYSFASFGMILVGLIAFVIVITFQRVTINNEGDYYSLKEAMEASLFESIDIPYYRDAESGGTIKIVEEKFIENFTRRFIKNTVGNSNGYVLEFYDIMESPPKASVIIKNKTESMTFSDEDFDVVNKLTGILVSKDEETSCTTELSDAYYYSYVTRSNTDSQGNYIATNNVGGNLNKKGQLLRAYSAINSDIYTYSYEKTGDPVFYFYDICSKNDEKGNRVFKDPDTKDLDTLYSNFVNSANEVCGYPFYNGAYKNQKKETYYKYAYGDLNNGCPRKTIDNDFTLSTDNLDNVSADKIISDSKYTIYYSKGITYSQLYYEFKKASEAGDDDIPDYVAFASNNELKKDDPNADGLYFISWSVPVERLNGEGGYCYGYNDNVLLIFKVTWKVTKCLK